MKPREEDHVYIPQKHFLSTHKSRWSAYKHCERACAERDGNPGELKEKVDRIAPSQILSTHFKILVVSNEFYRLNTQERMELVYEELLDLLGEHLQIPEQMDVEGNIVRTYNSITLPSQMKFSSYFGPSVRKLQIFRFLLYENCTLIIEAKTPSQWRPQKYAAPNSERYGSSHLNIKSISIPEYGIVSSTRG